MKNRGKELLQNTIIIAIGNLSTQIISFFLLPLYTSVLSTKDYGIYDLLITISTFILPIITLLMEDALFRFLIDCKTEEEKKEFYNANPQQFQKPATVRAKHILTKEEAECVAILESLKKGEKEFEEAAKEFSDEMTVTVDGTKVTIIWR